MPLLLLDARGEEVLDLPGLGPAAMAALRARDLPWIMPFVLALARFSAVLVLFADVLHGLVDPRVRALWCATG
ncbi:MAG: hypothetical protein IPJ34_24100 [Myxococcales bacterium]|nr:hypothetical protein [Myxococcales bacterium]